MDRDRILATARIDKLRGKEFENMESTRSSLIGGLFALLVGLVLFLLEYFVQNSVNVGLIAVGMTATGVQSLYEGIIIRKFHLVIIGGLQLAIAVIAILAVVGQVVFA